MAYRRVPRPSSPHVHSPHADPSTAMTPPFQRPALGTMNQANRCNTPAHDARFMGTNLPISPPPDQEPLDVLGLKNLQRPAIAHPELKMVTQITQQIRAIETITTFPVAVRLAIISDVASCLPTLHKILKADNTSRALIAKARKLIALLNAATIVEKDNLKRTLFFLSRARLPEGLTREDFVDYVDTLDSFIDLVRPFAKTVGLYDNWQDVVVSVLQQYFQLLPETGTGESPVETDQLFSDPWDGHIEDEAFRPMTPPNTSESAHNSVRKISSAPSLKELPQIDDSLDEAVALGVLEAIAVFLIQWIYLDPALYRSNAATCFDSLAMLADTMKAIESVNNRILLSEHVRESLCASGEIWTGFAQILGPAAEDDLAKRLFELMATTRTSPIQVPETTFSHIMDDIQAMSRHPLSKTPTMLETLEEGRVIGPKFAFRAKNFCSLLHHQWQTTTYQSELHQLWLLIWRSLKVYYKVKGRSVVDQSRDEGLIDAAFFNKPGVSATFTRLLKTSDAANPRSVEDMVARYCRLIAKCRNDPDDRYDHLRRYKEMELHSHVISSLEQFIKTGHPKKTILQKLHRAVVRFNFITKGPATVRRWTPGDQDLDWTIELLDLVSPTKTFAPGPNSPGLIPPGADTPGDDTFSGLLQSEVPYPLAINIKSAFDYVYYPFPETRAHEVAQSALISRELGEPGTSSDGLRAEDLINIPPRHVRGPFNISPFKWPAFVTPDEVINAVRNRVSRVRTCLWRRLRGSPSKEQRRRPGALRADSRRPATENRGRVRKHLPPKRGVHIRGGAGSQASPASRGSSPHSQRSDPLDVDLTDEQVEALWQGLGLKRDIRNDNHMLFWLRRTGGDVDTAAMQYRAYVDFESRSHFRGLTTEPYMNTMIAILEGQDWDVEDALAESNEMIRDFQEEVGRSVISPAEIAAFFRSTTNVSEAISFRQFELDQFTAAFKAGIIPGDSVTQYEIEDLYLEHKNDVPAAVNEHLANRCIHAPCYVCPGIPGGIHHTCMCTSEFPGFMTEAHENGIPHTDPTRCHRCPYFRGEYHHRRDHHPQLPAYQCRPERTRHMNDVRPVLEVLDSYLFRQSLANLVVPGTQQLRFLFGPGGFGEASLADREWRNGIGQAIANITNRTRGLREMFVKELSEYEPMPMDEVDENIKRRSDTARRSTVQLCHRSAIDLRASYNRLDKMLNREADKYALLSFRHEFGRFIRTLNELRSLYLDLVLHNDFDEQDAPDMTREDDPIQRHGSDDKSDDDSNGDGDDDPSHGARRGIRGRPKHPQGRILKTGTNRDASFSNDELPGGRSRSVEEDYVPLSATRIIPRQLPTRDEYNRMYLDELRDEIIFERNVDRQVVEQYPRKEDLIELLMRLDARGNYGFGARLGFHALKGYTDFAKDRRDSTWDRNRRSIVREVKHRRRQELQDARDLRQMQRKARHIGIMDRNSSRRRRRRDRAEVEDVLDDTAEWPDISSDETLNPDSETELGVLHSADPLGRIKHQTIKVHRKDRQRAGGLRGRLRPRPGQSQSKRAPAQAGTGAGTGGGNPGKVHTKTKPTGQPPKTLRKTPRVVSDLQTKQAQPESSSTSQRLVDDMLDLLEAAQAESAVPAEEEPAAESSAAKSTKSPKKGAKPKRKSKKKKAAPPPFDRKRLRPRK